MNEAQKGKDFILAFRKLKDAGTKTGVKLALQLEHTINKERSVETTQTKDGAVVSAGGLEVTVDITAVSTQDELNIMLEESVEKGEKLEIWEIDLNSKDESGDYDALYMRGNLNSWSTPKNVDGLVEISTTASIDGAPKKGKLKLSQEQEADVDYAFRDLVVVSEP